MTVKQFEERLTKLERRVAELQATQQQPKDGWRALIGIGTDDPVMKEVMKLAMKYREDNRRTTRPKTKQKNKRK